MADRFLRRGDPGGIIRKLCARAAKERGMIQEGDRILIAASGGKDSTVMAWALASLRRGLKVRYTLEALHISTDFCACCKKTALAARLEEWGIPFQDLFVPVIGRLKPGRKMNCYWCSTQRRTELLRYAVDHSFNKIALGHHLDDMVETFFMNLTARGELRTMPLSLGYRKYPVTLIRPLGYLEERQIIACAEAEGILRGSCTCPYGAASKRRDMRRHLAAFTGGSGAVKRRILAALDTQGLLEE